MRTFLQPGVGVIDGVRIAGAAREPQQAVHRLS